MISNSIIYIVLAASILALAFAFIFYKQMMKQDEGTDLMKKLLRTSVREPWLT